MTGWRRLLTLGVAATVVSVGCGGTALPSHVELDTYHPRSEACSGFTTCLASCLEISTCDATCGARVNANFAIAEIPTCYRDVRMAGTCKWGPDCLDDCAAAILRCAELPVVTGGGDGATGGLPRVRVGAGLAGAWRNKESRIVFAADGSYTYSTSTHLWGNEQAYIESGLVDDDGKRLTFERRKYELRDGASVVTADFAANRLAWVDYSVVETDIGRRLGWRSVQLLQGQVIRIDEESDYFYRE